MLTLQTGQPRPGFTLVERTITVATAGLLGSIAMPHYRKNWAGGSSELRELGWSPDGAVRGQYSVTTVPGSKAAQDFTVLGASDLDGDTNLAEYTATKSVKAILLTEVDTF